MRLLGVPDASGKATIWINADHLVSVQPMYRTGEADIRLEVELKVDGMPLQRIQFGAHSNLARAEEAFSLFLSQLQEQSGAV